ncbi:uncharacterized protein N7473_001836 [Penicillium subrubescens]|uniref:uncharacterized protein n=1 Tax=Penicillium subrubescens TaxID=1316194 RepID=UPI002545144E|nr:uncharacterized protein N7473_001836 [Penicillium subrubescens]KAJ5904920.1 hypothetical protein N7473_001836 [Penicillium subrubescens]
MVEHSRVGQKHTEEPPPYVKHDWRGAQSFWKTRESWSFFRRLKEALRVDTAFLKSSHWLTSPRDLQNRKYILYQAALDVKAFRREINRGELSLEVISQRKMTVYGRYARAMNEAETWTGYRFPCAGRVQNEEHEKM